MKNRLLPFLIVLFLSALTFGQDFKGIKILLNPGHGGHDPANDRFIPETGFWESDGNIDKGLMLRDIMQSLGAEIIMSRVTNNDADDLPLSQIVAMANNNNVHWMHSNHSNATGTATKANYTLMLYQGRNLAPTFPETRTMSEFMGNEILAAHRTTSSMLAGDFDFYGTGAPYLGVFRGLTVPGTLSEGSFHDYIPESWRLMNTAYKKHEAWAIAKSFIAYWGKTPISWGMIAGIVRDPSQGVGYVSLSTMPGDNRKPINNISVTLQPGNKVYKGDNFNNGFFMFDSLAPGTYKVIIQAKDFCTDSATVNVVANKTVFADKYLSYDTLSVPAILTYSPAASAVNIKSTAAVQISFSRKMQASSVESAFSITPKVDGTISWDNSGMTMTFTPALSYDKSTKYTVSLSANAKSNWNIPLAAALSFSFTTGSRNRVVLEKTYPEFYSTDISVNSLSIRLQFDAPLNSQTVANFVKLEAVSGITGAPVYSISTKTENGKGVVYLETGGELQRTVRYEVTIDKALTDADGNPLGETIVLPFNTLRESYISGKVIDTFESQGSWKNPVSGFASTGIDTTLSTIKFTYSKKMAGTYSARLAYVFTKDSGGVCQYFNSAKPGIGTSSSSEFGMWILSDYSFNTLEYWFYTGGSTNATVLVDTLNWTGWKLKRIPMSKIPGTGEKLFHSIVVKQAKNGLKNSIIYADEAQYDIVLPVEEMESSLPINYALGQNYPNPFNPSTTISYQLPENALVTLKLYDLLGREVASIINEQQTAGVHKVNFDAGKLTSGLYIYKLNAGRFSDSKKMLLVK